MILYGIFDSIDTYSLNGELGAKFLALEKKMNIQQEIAIENATISTFNRAYQNLL